MRCMVLRFQNDLSKVNTLLTFSFFRFFFSSLSLFVSSSFLYVFLPYQCEDDDDDDDDDDDNDDDEEEEEDGGRRSEWWKSQRVILHYLIKLLFNYK